MTRHAILLVSLALFACGPDGPAPPPVEEAAPSEEAVPADEVAPEGPVEVTAEGTSFDPPVTADRIPEGAWYCDMGTAHYAATDKGDGACPLCGMDLTQQVVPAVVPHVRDHETD